MANNKAISKEMNEFIDKVDELCAEYGFEIWPTREINERNGRGEYPTFCVHGKHGEVVELIYIDGDGRGK